MAEPSNEILDARRRWRWNGRERPSWAEEPRPGQESVWDYPRPPIVVPDGRRVVVRSPSHVIVDTTRSVRFLETAGAPTFYFAPEDVDISRLAPATGSSTCEWKGVARYWSLTDAPTTPVGWDYPEPFPPYEGVAGWFSFYPALLDCTVDGEPVRPQPGGFYGGWVTDEIVGPIKGSPGSAGW